jgi:hypothetical protein
MTRNPENVSLKTFFARPAVACILVRNISIGDTTIPAVIRAIDPATRGAYVSFVRRLMGLMCEYLSQSYPVKYMTLPGTAIANVGVNPRHNVVGPSFRAIFLMPSNVELNVLRCVSSTAQSAAIPSLAVPLPAKQKSPLFPTKKTSLQHAVTPRFGGSSLKSFKFAVYAGNFERLRGDGVGV